MEPDNQSERDPPQGVMPPWPQEQTLIDLLPQLGGQAILCTSLGVAQLARAAAERFPAAIVHCHFLDLYRAEQARTSAVELPANLSIGCTANFPLQPVDVVALPLSASGEAELARDLMQQAHGRLRPQGVMAVASDNPNDTWLNQEMHKLFGRVTRRVANSSVVYIARKDGELKKIKNFACEFVFRDRERLIHACSRPGVFAHRRVDAGARQLMRLMEVSEGERVLDIGCGSGALSLAAAFRAEGVHVHAIDSSARAVECTARGAQLNGLTNISTQLNATGNYEHSGAFQLVLANPPYYSNFQIAERFVLAGKTALEPGGRILLVTKSPDWYAEHMHNWYDDVQIQPAKSYYLVSGRKPS
jgi:16S rRNA (guanine1207-N2)-methyltransferase